MAGMNSESVSQVLKEHRRWLLQRNSSVIPLNESSNAAKVLSDDTEEFLLEETQSTGTPGIFICEQSLPIPSVVQPRTPNEEGNNARSKQASKRNIYPIHDKNHRRIKRSAIKPDASYVEKVTNRPPAQQVFVSKKHSTEKQNALPSSMKDASCFIDTVRTLEESDSEVDTSVHESFESYQSTHPQKDDTPTSSRILTVSPAPKEQRANMLNKTDTKLQEVERNGHLAELRFPAIVSPTGASVTELKPLLSSAKLQGPKIHDSGKQCDVKPIGETSEADSVAEGEQGSHPSSGSSIDLLDGVTTAWGSDSKGRNIKEYSEGGMKQQHLHVIEMNTDDEDYPIEESSNSDVTLYSEGMSASNDNLPVSQTPPMANEPPLIPKTNTCVSTYKTLTSTPVSVGEIYGPAPHRNYQGDPQLINVCPTTDRADHYTITSSEPVIKLSTGSHHLNGEWHIKGNAEDLSKFSSHSSGKSESTHEQVLNRSPTAADVSIKYEEAIDSSVETPSSTSCGSPSEAQKTDEPGDLPTQSVSSTGSGPTSPLLMSSQLATSALLSSFSLRDNHPGESCKSLAILSIFKSGKRSGSLPPYPRSVGRVLQSPCPEYGATQPTLKEAVQRQLHCYDRSCQATAVLAVEGTSKGSQSESSPHSHNGLAGEPFESEEEEGGSEVEEAYTSQTTLLHTAARIGNTTKLRNYLHQGYNINAEDHNGLSPLMCCISREGAHLPCADILIKEGCNLDHSARDKSTALHIAAFTGNVALVELLLLNGANPDIRDNLGRLPMHWATKPKSPKCLKIILEYSNFTVDEADDCSMTCLMWACYNDSPEVVKFILDKGGEIEEKDVDGLTALHWAVNKESVKCLKLLLKPERTFYKDRRGCTLLHRAAEHGSLKACQLVIRHRPDSVYDCDKKGRTPLHWASVLSRVDICEFLLENGSDAAHRDFNDYTALDYARERGYDYVVALMVCDETAVMDFARASRSVNVRSRLDKSVVEDIDSLSETNSLYTSQNSPSSLQERGDSLLQSPSSPSLSMVGSLVSARPGQDMEGYLGMFTKQGKGPLEHAFFWIDSLDSQLCWCQDERYKKKHKASKVLSVHKEASHTVKCRLDYSPLDAHRHVFHVILEDCVLDLLSYTDHAYKLWLKELSSIIPVKNITPSFPSSASDIFGITVTSREFEV